MPADRQRDLLRFLGIQADLLTSLSREGHDLVRCTSQMTLSFLTRAGFGWADDLLSALEDDDYVAAYNPQQQMIFLTPNHLCLMSHTLEDLHCRPWLELVERNEMITKILVMRAIEFGQGMHRKTLWNSDVPPHFLSEVGSPGSRVATCRSKFYSPIFKDGKPCGFLAANRSLPIASRLLLR